MMNRVSSIRAIACDYDGTLTGEGPVEPETLSALKRFKDSGRRLILVTGRELKDLACVFPGLDVFDTVVVENGAVLYSPGPRREVPLGDAPPPAFIEQLRRRNVKPLSVGRCVVATVRSQQAAVLEAIEEIAQDREIILNRNSLMVLPAGMDKSTGLNAALSQLGLTAEDTVGIGDAENDDAFLKICGIYVAVANAIPSIRDAADLITHGEDGAGIVEIVDKVVSGELQPLKARQ